MRGGSQVSKVHCFPFEEYLFPTRVGKGEEDFWDWGSSSVVALVKGRWSQWGSRCRTEGISEEREGCG